MNLENAFTTKILNDLSQIMICFMSFSFHQMGAEEIAGVVQV
jgi:hypothetical protein